jgi:hypothetical protein
MGTYVEHRSNADHFRFYVNGAYGERSEAENVRFEGQKNRGGT